MKRWPILLPLCALVIAGCSATKSAPAPAAPSSAAAPAGTKLAGTVGEQTVTATATVQSVDLKTRHVTLKDADGKLMTVVAGDEVRNLPQVKKGDEVRITYHESVAYQVSKAGTAKPGVSATTDVTRAAVGQKPGATVTNTTNVRTTIVGIDKPGSAVTLRGPEGNMVHVRVKDPSKLEGLVVGDVVDITYTEALAIAVEKPGR